MCKKERLALGIALLAVATSCSVDEITIPAEELFHREFIKSYGKIDPNQDWSVIKRSSITVSTSQSADVRVYARNAEGKTNLVASYREINGSETIYFDVDKDVQEVYVQSGTFFDRVPLESSVTITPAGRSRAIDGSDNLPGYKIDNGYYWGADYIEAIQEVLPEGNKKNIASDKVISDFSFVSTGREFVIYPIYWQTTANDVLGVYWYERGQMKTMDIFDNNVTVEGKNYHNIYHRATQGAVLSVMQCSIKDLADNVESSGTITLTFNRKVKKIAESTATLSSGTLSDPVIADDGVTVSYAYSGLGNNETVTFTLAEGAFEATDNTEGIQGTATNQSYTVTFTTADVTPYWQSTVFTLNDDGISGSMKLTFTKPVTMSTEAITFDPEMTIGDLSASDDSKTYTLTFSGLDYATTYKATLNENLIVAKGDEGVNADISGYDNAGKNTFTTPGRPIKYQETATLVNFTPETKAGENNGKIYINGEPIKSGDNIVEDGTPLSARLIISNIEKFKTVNLSEKNLTYKLPGFDDPVTFKYGFKIKASTSNGECTPEDGDYAVIKITPKADMLLNVYGFAEKENSTLYPAMYDSEAGNDLTANNSSAENVDGWTALTVSYSLTAEKTYYIYNKGQSRLAGLSYQLEDESGEAVVTSMSSRAIHVNSMTALRSRAGESIDLGNNGKKPDFWVDGQEPGHDYTRTINTTKDAVSSKGRDEVLTHRVAFTLPEGVIFGFYIRNNNGAIRITQPGEGPAVPYTCYSMSSLNQELSNSFFNSLDFDCSGSEAAYFKDGWGTTHNGSVHSGLKENGKAITFPESRKHSTAMTYTIDVNGQEMRYFSFEDWVDYDFNDIAFMVAPESAQDLDILDLEVDTNPYIFAVEDLGGTTSSDIDFNDAVFAVEHVSANDKSTNCLFVTMLAAGGTYPIQLMFDGIDVDGTSTGGIIKAQSIVHGPHSGTNNTLTHINEWFNVSSQNTTINVAGDHYAGFGNLTTVRIDLNDDNYTLAPQEGDKGKFSIRVARPDGTHTTIEPPSETGTVPQFLILPCSWRWPQEGKAIHDAYPGGVSAGGSRFGSFQDWVNDGYNYTFKDDPKSQWHQNPTIHIVMDHAWQGSQAARELISNLKSPSAAN